MEIIKTILANIFIGLVFIYSLPIIFVGGIGYLILYMLSTPSRIKEKHTFTEKIAKLKKSGKIGFLSYDRNYMFSDFIEELILPKYKEELMYDTGFGDRDSMDKRLLDVARDLHRYSELANKEDVDYNSVSEDDLPARLYTFTNNGMVLFWDLPYTDDGKLDFQKSERIYSRALETAHDSFTGRMVGRDRHVVRMR